MPRTKSAPVKQEPPSADLNEVKRRFLRQNRELAKINSTQSLRIRVLESEKGRLLAENLALQSRILQLQNEHRKASVFAIERARADLQARIADTVRQTFDALQQEEPVDKKAILTSSDRQYRERQPLTELMRDTQMSPIAEDKIYPRRSWTGEEIRHIRLSDRSSNSSFDLGPPPVAHLDETDPVKEAQPVAEAEECLSLPTPEGEELFPESVLVNLETRRKRRDGQPRPDVKHTSFSAQSPGREKSDPATSVLRVGAKRKLADCESDKPMRPTIQADFNFRSRAKADLDKTKVDAAPLKTETSNREKPALTKTAQPQSPARPTRKALMEKNANLSPKKQTSLSDKNTKDAKPAAFKAIKSDDRAPARTRRNSSMPLVDPAPSVVDVVEVQLEPTPLDHLPQTPTGPDFFSPASSEPSTRPTSKCDTPPPGDLSTMSNTTDGGQRPSRRARSAVNYAEPSLIAKMRRPDKQMVDAISGLHDPRRVMNGPKEKKAEATIKQEPQDDSMSSNIALHIHDTSQPDTPLQGKGNTTIPTTAADAVLPPTVSEPVKRRHRTSSAIVDPAVHDPAPLAQKMEELDLYEFKDSSPATDTSSRAASPEAKVKTHRRHSSVPKPTLGAPMPGAKASDAAVSKAASRRRSMMI